MLTRLAKISLVASSALFLLIVVFNNLTDYGSNFEFVRHVLSMDTTFPGNRGMWRAMTSPLIHHIFYALIIVWELVAGVMLAVAAGRMWNARAQSTDAWRKASSLAVAGLTVSLLQWLIAFIIVGGEWLLMWQSTTWNGQTAAARMFIVFALILIFLNQRDDEVA
jgi:predicted small integral membrane protein